jgi:rhamnulokinase
MSIFAAVDLGASSGRVLRVTIAPSRLDAVEVYRFPNQPRLLDGALRWDFAAIEAGVLAGLERAGPLDGVRSLDGIGIDSWAVDYGLVGEDGTLLADPVCYRDGRTEPVVTRVHQAISAERLYTITGTQHQSFNTLFQLCADTDRSARVLLIPDLLSWRLTGVAGTELTNASTTGLLDPRARTWSPEIAAATGIDVARFPPLRSCETGAGYSSRFRAPVFAVGSHDTASAVAGVPATTNDFAYISSGTWSLVGVELDAPVLTSASREANFSNELGVDGTVRFLKNLSGLWLLQECLRSWGVSGGKLAGLLAAAAGAPARRSVIDVADRRFLSPGDMPGRIAAASREREQPEPRSRPETVRCILDSLAVAYRDAIDAAVALSGRRASVLHVVGGGARNELLCQLTADATGLPVIAGPAEAAALGNALTQARAAGALDGGLAESRALIAGTLPLMRYEPSAGLRILATEPGGDLGP